ncbi:MAG: dihydroorotase [Candidatus Ratteibacteria bacterium]
MMNIHIQNIRLLDPASQRDEITDIVIQGGNIVSTEAGVHPETIPSFNGTGLWIFPGLIDIHCHLREPGFEEKETLLTGSRAAAAGGFTTICCMPNTNPSIDNKIVAGYIMEQARSCPTTIIPFGTITMERQGLALSKMGELAEAGVVGFSDDGSCVMNSLLFRRALEYSKIFNKPVVSHSEDHSLTKGGVMNESLLSTKLGLRGIPRESEEIMIHRDILLAQLTCASLHLAHLSTAGSVHLVREAKKRLPSLTSEVTIHHLHLTEEAIAGYNPNAKVSPPLRLQSDIDALLEGLRDKTIDAIVTDHAPHTEEEKQAGLDNAPFGMVGFETCLSLAMQLVNKGFSPLEIVEKLTTGPAKIARLPVPSLQKKALADFVIFDPATTWRYDSSSTLSKSCNSPFLGELLQGKILATVHKGKLIFGSL